MYATYIKSDRVLLQDLDNDKTLELIYSKLSDIHILDAKTNKLKYKIRLKPKVERKTKEQEIARLRSIREETEITPNQQSLTGEFLLKLAISDIDNDGELEIIYLRADGILGAVKLSGKEVWSHYLGSEVTDFITINSNNSDLKVLAIRPPDVIYGVDRKGHLYNAIIDINGQLRFIRIFDDKLLLASREGILICARVELKGSVKKNFSIDILSQKSFLRKGNIVSMDIIRKNNNKKYILVGFDREILILDEKFNELKQFSFPQSDPLMGLFYLEPYNLILALSWMGNVTIIDANNEFTPKNFAFNRNIKIDIDSDGEIEEIRVVTKNLKILRGDNIIFYVKGRSYITSYLIEDIDNDSKLEVLVGWHSKSISIYKYQTGELSQSIKLPFTPRSIITIDIDNDGKKELIIIGEDTIMVGYLIPPVPI